MKKVLYTTALVILVMAMGCKKDDNTNNSNNNNSPDYYITYKVNGVDFRIDPTTFIPTATGDSVFGGIIYEQQGTQSGNVAIYMDGDKNDTYPKSRFEINASPYYHGTGTYNIPSTLNYTGGTSYSIQSDAEHDGVYYEAGTFNGNDYTGTLTIVSETATVAEGSFQFDAYCIENGEVVHITEGKFKLPRFFF